MQINYSVRFPQKAAYIGIGFSFIVQLAVLIHSAVADRVEIAIYLAVLIVCQTTTLIIYRHHLRFAHFLIEQCLDVARKFPGFLLIAFTGWALQVVA